MLCLGCLFLVVLFFVCLFRCLKSLRSLGSSGSLFFVVVVCCLCLFHVLLFLKLLGSIMSIDP